MCFLLSFHQLTTVDQRDAKDGEITQSLPTIRTSRPVSDDSSKVVQMGSTTQKTKSPAEVNLRGFSIYGGEIGI